MKVAEWIRSNPGFAITVSPGCPLEKVMDQMLAESCLRDIYIVSDEGRLVGHLSHHKLIHFMLAEHRPAHTRRQLMERIAGVFPAEELMDSEVIYAKPEEELDNVLNRQLEHGIDDMPVIDDDGVMVGVININTVLRKIQKDRKAAAAMNT